VLLLGGLFDGIWWLVVLIHNAKEGFPFCVVVVVLLFLHYMGACLG